MNQKENNEEIELTSRGIKNQTAQVNKNDETILWNLYQDRRTREQFHLNQRTVVTNFIIVLSTIIIGVITMDKKILIDDLPLTMFLAALGLFGALFTKNESNRFSHHRAIATDYVRLVKSGLSKPIKDRVDEIAFNNRIRQRDDRRRGGAVSFSVLWMCFHMFIFALGVTLSAIILLNIAGELK